MEIGTVETIDAEEEPQRRRPLGRVGGSGSGSNGGNGGGGGNGPNEPETDDAQRFNANKSRVFTFFLLIAIVMTFGGVIAAYVVIHANRVAEWRPFDLPPQVWLSTIIIVASSITYEFAKRSLANGRGEVAKKLLIVTTALGAAFISSQLLLWLALVGRGYYMSGSPYAGFFTL